MWSQWRISWRKCYSWNCGGTGNCTPPNVSPPEGNAGGGGSIPGPNTSFGAGSGGGGAGAAGTDMEQLNVVNLWWSRWCMD